MNKNWVSLGIAAIIGLVAGLLLWRVLPIGAAKTELEWKFQGQSLKPNVAKDLSDPEAMFKKLFEMDFARAGTLALLKNKNVFSIQDSSFVEALKNYCPDQIGKKETFEERQKRLAQCLEVGTLKELRRLALDHVSPFQYIGTKVQVATPQNAKEQPPSGHANVCKNGGFLGYTVQLTDPTRKSTITVEATGSYPCIGLPGVPDIQLNASDASALFGRPTMKYENAIAVVL